MRYLLLFMLLVGIFVVNKQSCHFAGTRGTGPVVSETRTQSGFNAIRLELGADLDISTGDFNVSVSGQQNILSLLKSEVRDSVLHLYFDDDVASYDDLKIRVSLPSIQAVAAAGSGNIRFNGNIVSDALTLDVIGSGEINLPQGNIRQLTCTISGSGKIELQGMATAAELTVTGSGDILASGLKSDKVSASISGSGNIACQAIQTLNASIAGSGDISYYGNPALESRVTGSGNIVKADSGDTAQ